MSCPNNDPRDAFDYWWLWHQGRSECDIYGGMAYYRILSGWYAAGCPADVSSYILAESRAPAPRRDEP